MNLKYFLRSCREAWATLYEVLHKMQEMVPAFALPRSPANTGNQTKVKKGDAVIHVVQMGNWGRGKLFKSI